MRAERIADMKGTRTLNAIIPRIVSPLQEFLSTETAGAVLLFAATVAALAWANLPGTASYVDFWNAHAGVDFNVIDLDESLRVWVNDGLMTVFFFVVGLEIKREVLQGELADRRKATLPVAAALGGMVVPAGIYLAFNLRGAGEHGWGIPMATDIAFAVGVLALLGRRVPLSLKVFLLALAIVDDIGAILVIAVFYSDGITLGWLALAAGVFALIVVLARLGVRDVLVYVAVGAVAWLAIHESGVHATIAGVVLGLLTPSRAYYDIAGLEGAAAGLVGEFQRAQAEHTREGHELSRSALRALEDLSRNSRSPLDRLEHALHPWTSYAIVPVFALANAGVAIDRGIISDAVRSPVAGGIMFGLVVGKPAGILLFSWLAVRLGLAALPGDSRWPQIAGVAVIGGIGFTVSLFIDALAFDNQQLIDEAKIAILAGSAVAGTAGYVLLRALTRPAPAETADREVAVIGGPPAGC